MSSDHHIISLKAYYLVFAALLVLLVATVAVTQLDPGPVAIIVAMTIAVTKAVLIALVFMHLRYSSSLTNVFACASIVWLVIMLGLMSSDFLVRDESLQANPARSAASAPR